MRIFSISTRTRFNPQRLKRQLVTYGDMDFLRSLSSNAEEAICRDVMAMLRERLSYGDAGMGTSFEEFRNRVKENFSVPFTAITPVIERLLFALSSIRRPKRILCIGSYCGNALVWMAGPHLDNENVEMFGIDIDAQACSIASKNFARLCGRDTCRQVHIIQGDAMNEIENLVGSFDFVYFDADNAEEGKRLYLKILRKISHRIVRCGWVLAHDTTFPYFANDLVEYLAHVRDKSHFAESISLDLDPYGLELSIKP